MSTQNAPVETYRREDGTEEVAVYHDTHAPDPLEYEPWFRFLTLENRRYRHGAEQLTREELDERCAAAAAQGADRCRILPVYMHDHGGIAFSLGAFSDAWDSGQCGVVILERTETDKAGIDWEKVPEVAEKVLRLYEAYVMGWCYRFERYRLQRCNLGETHRIDVTEETDECNGRGDWYGVDPKESGLLAEAGIGDPEDPTRLHADWREV